MAKRDAPQLGYARVAAIAIVLVPLAGCLGIGGDNSLYWTDHDLVEEPVVGLVIEHEEGTARLLQSDYAAYQAERCGALGQTLGEQCQEVLYPALDAIPQDQAGIPAPYLDILEVQLAETSYELTITMTIAELDEQWSGLQIGQSAIYASGWTVHGWDHSLDNIQITVSREQNGINIWPLYWVIGEQCSDYWVCEGGPVEFELEYGSPGKIHMTVQRDHMPDAEEGVRLNEAGFYTWQSYGRYGFLHWDLYEEPVGETGRFFGLTRPDIADGVGWGSDDSFTFTTPLAPADRYDEPRVHHEHVQGNTYDITGQPRPDIDIWETSFTETESTLTFSTRLGHVEPDPREHYLSWDVAMPTGRVHNLGYNVEDGERSAWAGYNNYSTGQPRWIDHPVDMTVVEGPGGWVNFTLSREDLEAPSEGDRLGFIWVWTWLPESSPVQESVGPARVIANHYLWDRFPIHDAAWGWVSPYWFHFDTDQKAVETYGIQFDDDVGDAQMPVRTILDRDQASQYDITYVEVIGHDEDTLRASIGIDDLSRLSIPTGYEAIVYAVGLETADGPYMVFFIKDQNQQDYYCAPDSLVFSDAPSDPRETVLTPSTGHQSAPRTDGPATGALTLYVPVSECLGVQEAGSFEVTGVGAGTYLLEDRMGLPGTSAVETVDTAKPATEGPFQLGVEAIAQDGPGSPAWYVAPLGLEGQDWNILGVVLAVLLAAGGAIAVWTKRRKLRQYLARVDQATAIKDLTARETALGELRTLLRADLVAGQVSEGHYAVVMRHIDEAMKHVRVRSIEETFRELPFHIVSKLRSVLDDGVITKDEHEMVTDLIERAQIPSQDKRKVLSRLERWQLVDEVVKA